MSCSFLNKWETNELVDASWSQHYFMWRPCMHVRFTMILNMCISEQQYIPYYLFYHMLVLCCLNLHKKNNQDDICSCSLEKINTKSLFFTLKPLCLFTEDRKDLLRLFLENEKRYGLDYVFVISNCTKLTYDEKLCMGYTAV